MTNTATTNQAASRLGISPRRVRQLIKDGLLVASKVGRDWLVCQSSLDSLVKVHRQSGRPRKQADLDVDEQN